MVSGGFYSRESWTKVVGDEPELWAAMPGRIFMTKINCDHVSTVPNYNLLDFQA